MKFSTSTITTAFALVAVSGLCTIPTSVEARKKGKEVELKAMIDNDVFKGTVCVTQKQRNGKGKQQITDAKWVIDIEFIDADICKDVCDADEECNNPQTKLNWHVHEKAIPENGVCEDTGGHWDPTFGCGPKSQYKTTLCSTIATDVPGRVNVQSCDPKTDIATCEMGDLSSKMGQVKIKAKKQKFSDDYISNLDNIKDLSIVFHCGGPRVACGNFELV